MKCYCYPWGAFNISKPGNTREYPGDWRKGNTSTEHSQYSQHQRTNIACTNLPVTAEYSTLNYFKPSSIPQYRTPKFYAVVESAAQNLTDASPLYRKKQSRDPQRELHSLPILLLYTRVALGA